MLGIQLSVNLTNMKKVNSESINYLHVSMFICTKVQKAHSYGSPESSFEIRVLKYDILHKRFEMLFHHLLKDYLYNYYT